MLAVFLVSAGCKKDKFESKEEKPPFTTDRNQLTKDSMFLYAKQVFLWNDELPSYSTFSKKFNFNASSDHLSNLNDELFAITRYGKNPLTKLPYEYNPEDPSDTKYSFIEDLVADGKLAFIKNSKSNIDFNGEGNDFGFSVVLFEDDGSRGGARYSIFTRFTSPGSPAFVRGLRRGAKIERINARAIGTNYFQGENVFIDNALDQNSIAIAGKNLDGSSFNLTLNKTIYKSSPIFKDTVLIEGSKKIGYLAYARFTDDENSNLPLTNVFSKFSSAGVTDLVIDLRYNPGGYVSTAEHLINLIAPTSLNDKLMFAQTYNKTMQSGNATILKNQPLRDQQGQIVYSGNSALNYFDNEFYSLDDNKTFFSKEGTLDNISKVVFITTGGTASSSELVINSLKPFLTVKTVGSTSYGKPVGFFPIRIDKYDLYLSSFFTTNSNGEGNYFAGIKPDAERDDDVRKGFGDPTEESLSSAILFLTDGKFTANATDRKVNGVGVKARSNNVLKIYEPAVLKGMIATPKIN